MSCERCQQLDICTLVKLARGSTGSFPGRSSDYHHAHHTTVTDLVASAQSGCGLCKLLVQALDSVPMTPIVMISRPDGTSTICNTVLQHAEGISPSRPTNITLAIPRNLVTKYERLDLIRIFVGNSTMGSHTPALVISTPRDQPLQLDTWDIGRFELEPDLGSKANLQIVKGWLQKCQSNHGSECGWYASSASDDPHLPTRVIDVGKPGDGSPVPRLLVSKGTRANYLALSHCWGGQIDTILKTDCLDEFLQALPWARLARNFQDAIQITRGLGIRYLWIDALCIIQDSNEDWALESEKMAALYENALFTIAAFCSPRSSHGILPRQQVAISAREPSDVQVTVSGDKIASLHIYRPVEEEDLAKLTRSSPMTQRGWCLQESVLSRRILYFGLQQIYWECAREYYAADGRSGDAAYGDPDGSPGVSALRESLRNGKKARLKSLDIASADSHQQQTIETFYNICCEYSRRRLTYDTDKLPAMSGVAKRLHDKIGGDYLAGTWSVGFKGGLLWSRDPGGSGLTRVGNYRAPSWSWASVDGEIRYDWVSHSSASRHAYDIQLLSFDIQLKDGRAPYGQVISGWALVRGMTTKLRLIYSSSGFRAEEEDVASCDFDDPEMAAFGPQSHSHLVHIDISRTQSCGPTLYIRTSKSTPEPREYLVVWVRKDKDYLRHSGADSARCVVLEEEKSGGSGSGDKGYRRVGVLTMYPAKDKLITTWEKQTLKLI